MDSDSNDETDLMLLDTTDDEDDTFVLDDLTLELTDCTTDFCTLSLSFELAVAEESAETLDWKLSWTFFSAFCCRLDCTLPSTRSSLSSATLRCDLLALSMKPVAVFSQLDWKGREEKSCAIKVFSSTCPNSPLTSFPTMHFLFAEHYRSDWLLRLPFRLLCWFKLQREKVGRKKFMKNRVQQSMSLTTTANRQQWRAQRKAQADEKRKKNHWKFLEKL